MSASKHTPGPAMSPDQIFIFVNGRHAREHWGAGGESDRPDCLALVEKIAAKLATKEGS